MNYHSDEWIMAGVQRHYDEVLRRYRPEQVVGVFYFGSANYQADYEKSDIDTWAIIIEDTYESESYEIEVQFFNKEVIKYCDIRAYINGILHSDWQYLLTLYTKYYLLNPLYEDLVVQLFSRKEKFAYNDVVNNTSRLKYWANNYCEKFQSQRVDGDYGKTLYYCLLIFLHINTYIYHDKYETLFNNEYYGKQLSQIKTEKYSYWQCRKMLNKIMRSIEKFNPTYKDYPQYKDLLPFVQNIKTQFIERYINGYSN